ncbi:hypothetical protein SNE25_04710 [Mucilaginibacter sabulilitoris]|uniref:Uncharacterized protein n=1 Tax=Mucilaginibacter sabulilitoris TaxID=1173583 RepID=A0ABZ0TQW3_9SPHI|nr:hypothetical protein [Mucilaginibacter sabulilitoris]WPU94822.1 hypothetical protein SNE25_04710 [Mucilaginibacter sabulilitoris]
MTAKVRSLNRHDLLNAGEAIERILSVVDSAEIKNELLKWLEIGFKDHSKTLANFSSEELAIFLDKLPDLVLALYCYQKETEKGDDK